MSESLVQRIFTTCHTHSHLPAQQIKDADNVFQPCSYQTLMTRIMQTAYFFKHECQVSHGQNVGIICDNKPEWPVVDLALQSISAVNVPRGSDTAIEEIAFILEHSHCIGCVFEHTHTFEQLMEHHAHLAIRLRFVIFLEDNDYYHKNLPEKTFRYHDIIKNPLSDAQKEDIQHEVSLTKPDNRTTIIYTSGTTAKPKGVCLTQKSFLVQIDDIVPHYIPLKPGDVFLSILPVWHAYAREIQYIILAVGATIAYSKPIGSVLLKDIIAVHANYLTSVPRIWEGVYKAIYAKIRNASPIRKTIFKCAVAVAKKHCQLAHAGSRHVAYYHPKHRIIKKLLAYVPYILLFPLRQLFDVLVFKKLRALLGPHFIAGVSGGGALSPSIDAFFEAAKITVLEGYGLTETAPILSVRNALVPEMNSVGKILPNIEYKIVDNHHNICTPGNAGILHIRSPQVMQGYYHNEEATKAVLDEDGWLNTGDLVMESYNSCIKVLGREKDTIVLSSGENIEPEYVENTFKENPSIAYIVVVGQDQKHIAALISPDPETLFVLAEKYNMPKDTITLCKNPQIHDYFKEVLHSFNHILNKYEQVHHFTLIPHEFTIGKELTQTLKLKRPFIVQEYKKEIQNIFSK